MPSILFYAAVTAASAGLLALLVRIIDARVNESIEQHVTAVLGPPPREEAFEAHVTQALRIVDSLPVQRRGAEDLTESR